LSVITTNEGNTGFFTSDIEPDQNAKCNPQYISKVNVDICFSTSKTQGENMTERLLQSGGRKALLVRATKRCRMCALGSKCQIRPTDSRHELLWRTERPLGRAGWRLHKRAMTEAFLL
jgi:hypothetical protein